MPVSFSNARTLRPAVTCTMAGAALALCALLLMAMGAGTCAYAAAYRCTDDTGKDIVLRAPAQRIIALYGAYNEVLYGMGLGQRIVARTDADTEPAALRGLPVIGTHMRPNPELIVGLAPDLVLQMEGRREADETVANLRALGITVAVFRVGSFAELFSVINRVGALTDTPEAAQRLTTQLQQRLNTVRDSIAAKPARRPRVFFEVRHPNLLAAGADSIVTDIITHAGGSNAVEVAGRVARLNEEELLRLDPDVYLYQRGPMNPAPDAPSARPHYAPLRAVREGRTLEVDEQRYSRPGLRAVDAVEELARYLHPAAFSAPSLPSPAMVGVPNALSAGRPAPADGGNGTPLPPPSAPTPAPRSTKQ